MRIAVTGGAGFVGSNLAVRLLQLGHQVLVIDDLSTGRLANIPVEAEFIQCDLSKEDSVNSLPCDVDVIYHLAGQASSELSMTSPGDDVLRNPLATIRTIEWAQHSRVKTFVYASTMGVYRDSLDRAAVETDTLSPKSVYGVSKRASEDYIRVSKLAQEASIFRLFNVYGPGQDLSNMAQGMVSIYLAQLLNANSILVKGPLDRVRDFVFITDVVDALVAGLDRKAFGATFNVATGRPTTVKALLELIGRTWAGGTYIDVAIGPRTPADIDSCFGNPKKIETTLGWRPRVSLEEGIARTVASLEAR